MRPIDIQRGARFGRLVVTGPAESKKPERHFLCQCDCGQPVVVASSSLRRGAQRSCGCLKKEADEERSKKARETIAERFWARAERGHDNQCWPWLGYVNKNGYGLVRIPGKQMPAHRLAWELINGPMPVNLLACHHCDNRTCVNPSHVYAGTYADNAKDAVDRNRTWHAKGLPHPTQRMTEEQAAYVRSSNKSLRALAKELGFTYGHIGKVRRGEVLA